MPLQFPQIQNTTSQSDCHDSSGRRNSPSYNQLITMQYPTIGETLLTCEAACHRVGIPWLPPTENVRRRSSQYEGPLEDFIRYSLVTVSSKTLVSYCDDLETSGPNSTEAEQLSIPYPTPSERYAFPALVFGILFATDFLLCRIAGVPFAVSIVSSAIIGLLGGATCAALCIELHRRKTFHWLLVREVMRRSGQDESNSTTVPILPVSPEPLSD